MKYSIFIVDPNFEREISVQFSGTIWSLTLPSQVLNCEILIMKRFLRYLSERRQEGLSANISMS